MIDRSRSDVASLKRITKQMVENFQQLLGIVTHVFETKTLQAVDPASKKEPPKLSNILEELDDEAYDFLRFLGIAEDSRAQGQTLLSLMSSCTILSHVLLLGISAYAGSHSSLFAEELFGLPLTDFRLSRPSGDIFFSLMDLACMHDFIGGPIWVFTEESRLTHTEKLCVSMYTTDLDDLWGPAYFRSKNGSDQVELIEIERGAIVKIRDSSQHDEVVCHYVAWDAVEAQGLDLPPEFSSVLYQVMNRRMRPHNVGLTSIPNAAMSPICFKVPRAGLLKGSKLYIWESLKLGGRSTAWW